MASIDRVMRRIGGAQGVPVARHALAVAILAVHSVEVSDRYAAFQRSPFGVAMVILPAMLFALVGFVLAHAMETRSPRDLFVRRARRIVPPLFVMLVLTVLTLGAAFSNDRLDRFLAAPETLAYFGNLVGFGTDRLPGVFVFNNAAETVNRTLWMLPVTYLACLLAVLLSGVGGRMQDIVLGLLLAGITAFAIVLDQRWIDPYDLPRSARALTDAPGIAAITALLAGMLCYRHRNRVPYSFVLVLVGVAALGMGAVLFGWNALSPAVIGTLVSIPSAYVLVYGIVSPFPIPHVFRRVNYSYGLLLYGYPVQQAWIAVYGNNQSILANFALSLPLTLLLAAGSWHLLERRIGRPTIAMSAPNGSGAAPAEYRIPEPRPFGWYVRRIRRAAPGLAMLIGLVALLLTIMAITMFALQREASGM